MNIDFHLIGARIKAKRKEKGYTQEIMAEKLDVSVGYISQVERGITKISLDLLAAIADILTCDVAVFISEASYLSEHYLTDEIARNYQALSVQDKKLVSDFIKLLLTR